MPAPRLVRITSLILLAVASAPGVSLAAVTMTGIGSAAREFLGFDVNQPGISQRSFPSNLYFGKEIGTGELAVQCGAAGRVIILSDPDPSHSLVPESVGEFYPYVYVLWSDKSKPGVAFQAAVDCDSGAVRSITPIDAAAQPFELGTSPNSDLGLTIYTTTNAAGGINLAAQRRNSVGQPMGPPVNLTPPTAEFADQNPSAAWVFPDKIGLGFLHAGLTSQDIYTQMYYRSNLAPVPGTLQKLTDTFIAPSFPTVAASPGGRWAVYFSAITDSVQLMNPDGSKSGGLIPTSNVGGDPSNFGPGQIGPLTWDTFGVFGTLHDEQGDNDGQNVTALGDDGSLGGLLTVATTGAYSTDFAFSNVKVASSLGSQPAVLFSRNDATPGIFEQVLEATSVCIPSDNRGCLVNGQFQFDVAASTGAGDIAPGHVVMLTNDTAYVWFFNQANVEMVLKVINGCALGGNYWVFAGGLTNVQVVATVLNTQTGQVAVINNSLGVPFQTDLNTAALSCAIAPPQAAAERVTNSAVAADGTQVTREAPRSLVGEWYDRAAVGTACVVDATHLCLNGGRFKVSSVWQTSDGTSGPGQAVPILPPGVSAPDTGYFWFFGAANVEMVVKVIQGCGVNSHYWVFAGGLTNVKVTTTVLDTKSGLVKTYRNPAGTPFLPLQDTSAFATCP
jgi:hypothetical protein